MVINEVGIDYSRHYNGGKNGSKSKKKKINYNNLKYFIGEKNKRKSIKAASASSYKETTSLAMSRFVHTGVLAHRTIIL